MRWYLEAQRWAVGLIAAAVLACPGAAAFAQSVQAPAADTPLPPGESKQVSQAANDEEEGGLVGWLEISGRLREGPIPFAWVHESDADPSLDSVLAQLRYVAENDAYRGVVIYLDTPELSLTQVEAIRDAITRCRGKGRKVFTFAESYSLRDYLLASAADLILLQHNGDVNLSGIGVEEVYLAGLFDLIGVKADLLQVGRFKGADEPLTRREPSEAWSQNMDALLDDLYAQVVDPIAKSRSITRAQLEALMRDCWTMDDEEYLARRVVDRLVERDLIVVTEVEFGEDFYWDKHMGQAESSGPNMDNPFALFRVLFQEPKTRTRRDSIAIVHARGPISSGDSRRGDGLFGSDAIGSRTLVETLGKARDDTNIKGIVLALDSPGGSALASEVIWQAVREVQEDKPVYASIGPVAASGGYYIACAASRIYVAPASIVGSIGVVGGKFVLGGLYEKIGVNITRRSRGPLGDMFNSVQPFTSEERERVQGSMQRVYDQFTDRVKKGRGARLSDVNGVAEGRLFTGAQAVTNGLADEVGDLQAAVAALAKSLNLGEGEYDIVHLPPPMNFSEFMENLFGASSSAQGASGPSLAAVEAARRLMGEAAWQRVAMTLDGMMLLRREPVLCIMPAALIVR